MELRDYLKVYWRQRGMILWLIILATGIALGFAATRPIQTGVSVAFAVNRTNQVTTNQYEYDGYYALQAADLFSQTVVSWFSTPSVLRDVYDRAGLDPEIKSLNSLPARFSVKKYSAQNIVVRYNERTRDRASKVATALTAVISDRTSEMNKSADGKSIFEIVGGTPVIAEVHPNLLLIGIVTAVLSLALGLMIAALRHYLKQ